MICDLAPLPWPWRRVAGVALQVLYGCKAGCCVREGSCQGRGLPANHGSARRVAILETADIRLGHGEDRFFGVEGGEDGDGDVASSAKVA